MQARRWRTSLVVAVMSVLGLAACSGSSSPSALQSASTSTSPSSTPSANPHAAAVEAAAACRVVTSLHGASGTSKAAQAAYSNQVAAAFAKSAELAAIAAQEDPRWSTLEASAKKEAAAFGVVAAATTNGTSDVATVQQTAAVTRTQRPIYVAQCNKALKAG
jgi:hypothetical protein